MNPRPDLRTLPGPNALYDVMKADAHVPVPKLQELDKESRIIGLEQRPIPEKDDEQFTDSGYASMPGARSSSATLRSQEPASGDDSKPISRGDEEDDMGTIYSAATTEIPNIAQESIDWVCDDIYGNLRLQVDNIGYKSLVGSLPRLIKAFAMQLAQRSSKLLEPPDHVFRPRGIIGGF